MNQEILANKHLALTHILDPLDKRSSTRVVHLIMALKRLCTMWHGCRTLMEFVIISQEMGVEGCSPAVFRRILGGPGT